MQIMTMGEITTRLLNELKCNKMTIPNPGEDAEKPALTHCLWGCKMVQPLWNEAWQFLKKTKLTLIIHPSNRTPAPEE